MSRNMFELEESCQLKTYQKYPMSIVRGEDVWVYTSEGQKYLDLYGGHAVVATGHCHPNVVHAIQKQASELIFYSNVVYNETRALAAEALCSVAPQGLKNAFFINSGAEANDNAIKLVRKVTGRPEVITFEGSFHGRTIGTLSATGMAKYREAFSPRVSDHLFAPFGDLDALESMMSDKTAGVMLEPVQSMYGARSAPPAYFKGLRDLCDKYGAMLVFDEIQTGMGRTGQFFFAPHHGVLPDIICLAKAIASGIPMGALLVSDDVASHVGYGDLGTTFGAGPVASAALLATVHTIQQDNLIGNVQEQSAYLRAKLNELPIVKATHGLGFLVGIEFEVQASVIRDFLMEHHIITGTSSVPNVLRLLPPLTLKRPEIDLFLDVLSQFSS
ncbi:MAG: aminotransferase class III-fold pyridoxal phosphate-dependent enzyme [Deltaproteobacteria bacterium]|nr:MAG: aminotransferase class III-fold pyridoxal phosphate-dependent enzyme [Deltaproteobacteria bacterium]